MQKLKKLQAIIQMFDFDKLLRSCNSYVYGVKIHDLFTFMHFADNFVILNDNDN